MYNVMPKEEAPYCPATTTVGACLLP